MRGFDMFRGDLTICFYSGGTPKNTHAKVFHCSIVSDSCTPMKRSLLFRCSGPGFLYYFIFVVL